MTYVVTTKCVGCKDTACASVCPCESFHEGTDQLYINPDSCIDCDACVVECPVDAIFHEDDLPEEMKKYVQINADQSEACENITERKEPLKKD